MDFQHMRDFCRRRIPELDAEIAAATSEAEKARLTEERFYLGITSDFCEGRPLRRKASSR